MAAFGAGSGGDRDRPRTTMTLARYQEQCGGNRSNCPAQRSQSLRRVCSAVERDQQQQLYDIPPPPRLHCSLENMLDVTDRQQQEAATQYDYPQRYSMEDILGGPSRQQQQQEGACSQQQENGASAQQQTQCEACSHHHQQQQQQQQHGAHAHPQQQEQKEPEPLGIELDRSATLNRLVEQQNMSTLQRSEQVVQYLDGMLDEQLRSMSNNQSDTLSSTHSYSAGGAFRRERSCSASSSRTRRDSNNDDLGEVADTPL